MSSSTSNAPHWKYDVFLSFRGKDTRNNFVSFLYDALCGKQIKTFIDDELERGEEITPALLRTIEESRISVVVFSKNYASSPWCVDELVKILECKKKYGQIVLPVFYHVDPSNVEEQTGSFGNAFAQLETKFKGKMDKVEKWRDELTNAANISGWDSQVIRPEATLVQAIVQHILKKLNNTSSSDTEGLVGIYSRIEDVMTLLHIHLPVVRIIGIWGMGGIGKTTIAGAVFNIISSQYEGSYFLANIREESEKCGGLVHLRQEFLSKIMEEENLHIGFPSIGPAFIKNRFLQKRVLVVFDDVNDAGQLEFLIGRRDLFAPGSRIIVTSRDRQVLKIEADVIYKVRGLSDHEALHLFSLNAVKQNQPPQDLRELSMKAVHYAKGNPLALKVLGSFLFDRRKQDWESALNKLDRISLPKIHDVLRIGFDLLDDEVKSIFLDIGCFFNGQNINLVKGILEGCGFSTDIGFSLLIDKCLLTISNDKLEMHDLLHEMAHEIVRQESIKELGRRSRLWNPRDVYQVLTKNLGTEKVEGIFLDISKIRSMECSSRAFARMSNLRLLKIYNSGVGINCKVQLPHGLEYLSDELRYLHWDRYPLRSLPPNFKPENLVQLNLSFSKVVNLWGGVLDLVNLNEINLSSCEHLVAIPDLSRATNLHSLNLHFCRSLVEVPSSIQRLANLSELDMRYCSSLQSLPSSFNLRSLQTLKLSGCSNLKQCPELSQHITYLGLNETAIEELPRSIMHLTRLVSLNLKDCKGLNNLPDSICLLKSLNILDLSGCSKLVNFPNVSESIRFLYLSDTAIEELPSSISTLSLIRTLDLANCTRLKSVPSIIFELNSLKKLILSGCSIVEVPSAVECLTGLVELHLRNCKTLEILPSSIRKLKSLKCLDLSGCTRLKILPQFLGHLERLKYLYLEGTALRELPSGKLCGLCCLEAGNLKNLVKLPRWTNVKFLRKVDLNGCNILDIPDYFSSLSTLESLDLSGNNFATLPEKICRMSELKYLFLNDCRRLRSLPPLPPQLTKIDANNCVLLERVSMSCTSLVLEGNIFGFLFTNCFLLNENAHSNIMAYALLKFRLYAKSLRSQFSMVPPGASTVYFSGREVPQWFDHQASGSSITMQLRPQLGDNFLGFALCAVITFEDYFDKCGFQVKCEYQFNNKYGDCHNLYCDFDGWYHEKRTRTLGSDHVFVGYDPCLDAAKDNLLSKYYCDEAFIKFSPVDMDNNTLSCCKVIKCGVRLFYAWDENPYQVVQPSFLYWTQKFWMEATPGYL